MKLRLSWLCLMLCSYFASSASAMVWNQTYFQISRGKTYELGTTGKIRTILKAAHSSSWRYGENYFYLDMVSPSNRNSLVYGELNPSLSLSKIFDRKVGFSVIEDIVPTAQFYVDELSERQHSYGLGLYLSKPEAFKYMMARAMYRKNIGYRSYSYSLQFLSQLNITHRAFLSTFVDWMPKEQVAAKTKNVLAKLELNLDVSPRSFPYRIYVGPGYSYWHNKLGTNGVNENAVRLAMRIYI